MAIFGAFGQEVVDLRRRMAVEETVAGRGCTLYRGKLENKDTVLVKTGMGRERVEHATHFALERYPVTAIISQGFAGGLSPRLRIGDVVVCSKMQSVRETERGWVSEGVCEPDAGLLALASQGPGESAIPFSLGSSVTVLTLDASTSKLQGLAEAFQADIVEMESYWIARIAAARSIPFIAIRSISDTAQETVQPFDRILSPDGRVLWGRAALAFLLHPWYLVNVYTLYKNTRPAKRNMAAFITYMAARISV